jgi:hypothetical protein
VVVVDGGDGGCDSGDGSDRCRFTGVYTYICIYFYVITMPIALAVRSKASVCGRSLVVIMHSNPAGGMDFCHL